jgi:NADH-quinone oxidoreductase subunit J
MFVLHFLLNLATIISVILLYTTTHPIYSVLLLVLLFCEASATLFIFNIEFLSLTFIVVYVGAIAVLFLFVVMMLNIKTLQHSILKKLAVFGSISILFLTGLYFMFKNKIINYDFFQLNEFTNFKINFFDSLNNLDVMGQLIFNEYALCLIVIGLLLLVPLLGSIVLTLDCSNITSNFVTIRQLSRSPNTTAFFK